MIDENIKRFTVSRKKLLNITIKAGINDCKYLLFVSRGIKIAAASRGEKFGGKPINLLIINAIIKNIKCLNIT